MESSVLQNWVMALPRMMQSVLIASVRGPDGLGKHHISKSLLKWLRRCVLVSAFDGIVHDKPFDEEVTYGGSFTGASIDLPDDGDWHRAMNEILREYRENVDQIPIHFHFHLLHAAEIIGYKHPSKDIRTWWHYCYLRLVNDMHLNPETEKQMDKRLGDDKQGWVNAQIIPS